MTATIISLHAMHSMYDAAMQATGTIAIVSTQLQLALHRAPKDDRVLRDYLESSLSILDGLQRLLVRTGTAASHAIKQSEKLVQTG